MINYSDAVDEIYSLFNEAWIAESASVVGYVPEVRWFGVQEKTKPEGDKYWVRVSTQSVDEEQTSLSACVAVDEEGDVVPASRFTATGLVFVQLFCPKSDARSIERGRLLSEICKKIYRGKKTNGGVWFRNVRINDAVAAEELWNRFNVVAEYEHDEIG